MRRYSDAKFRTFFAPPVIFIVLAHVFYLFNLVGLMIIYSPFSLSLRYAVSGY